MSQDNVVVVREKVKERKLNESIESEESFNFITEKEMKESKYC